MSENIKYDFGRVLFMGGLRDSYVFSICDLIVFNPQSRFGQFYSINQHVAIELYTLYQKETSPHSGIEIDWIKEHFDVVIFCVLNKIRRTNSVEKIYTMREKGEVYVFEHRAIEDKKIPLWVHCQHAKFLEFKEKKKEIENVGYF